MTYSVRTAVGLMLAPVLLLGACSDDDPAGPDMTDVGRIMVDLPAVSFGTIDVAFGASRSVPLTVTNTGDATLTVSSVGLTGSDDSDFLLESEGGFALAPGASQTLDIAFDPTSAGNRTALLRIASDDPDNAFTDVPLTGAGEVVVYRQVDREGIPTINTVFNHPPAFSKTDFNLAGPDSDLAGYTGQFEVVLGAVANADPQATAALLLPDELPVSLGEPATNFATLTGRALADDAVDIALSVVVGIVALQSDNVDQNDVPFLNQFPYLAEAH